MNLHEQIIFRKGRDFSETFNVSVKFLRQNFVSYFKTLLFLSGPFILLYCFTSAYYQSDLLHRQSLVHAGELYGLKKYDGIYFLSIVLQFLSYLTMMCTSYSYMLLYNERGKGNFNVGDVAKKMTAVIGKIIGAFFLFGFLILIFAVAVAFVINMIGSASPVFGVLLLLGLVVLILILFPNLSWQLCTLFLVIIAEEEIPLTAYGRTREVMKDNYWWTWLLMVCSNLMIMFVSAMFMIPELIYNLVLEAAALEEIQETSIVYIIVVITCTFCGTLVNAIGYVIGGFHFFSLEEKKDGAGLMERINDIGKTNAGI